MGRGIWSPRRLTERRAGAKERASPRAARQLAGGAVAKQNRGKCQPNSDTSTCAVWAPAGRPQRLAQWCGVSQLRLQGEAGRQQCHQIWEWQEAVLSRGQWLCTLTAAMTVADTWQRTQRSVGVEGTSVRAHASPTGLLSRHPGEILGEDEGPTIAGRRRSHPLRHDPSSTLAGPGEVWYLGTLYRDTLWRTDRRMAVRGRPVPAVKLYSRGQGHLIEKLPALFPQS